MLRGQSLLHPNHDCFLLTVGTLKSQSQSEGSLASASQKWIAGGPHEPPTSVGSSFSEPSLSLAS
jgi:hypothetical protein